MNHGRNRVIWAPYEAFFVRAMLFNTGSAVFSIESVSTAIEQISRDLSGDALVQLDRTAFLGELQNLILRPQNLILQAAALSRYFWPVRQGHEARASQLRVALDIADDNTLKNRGLRNEIEHFDEKLDAYHSDGIASYIFPEFVGPLPANRRLAPGLDPARVRRVFWFPWTASLPGLPSTSRTSGHGRPRRDVRALALRAVELFHKQPACERKLLDRILSRCSSKAGLLTLEWRAPFEVLGVMRRRPSRT